jgi:hypothetical protein
MCATFGLDWLRNVDLYKVQTNTHKLTFSFICKIICTTFWYHLSCALKHVKSWDTAVRTGTRLLAGHRRTAAPFPSGTRDLSLLRNVHNSCPRATSPLPVRSTSHNLLFLRHTRLSGWKSIFRKQSWDLPERLGIRQAQHSSRIKLVLSNHTHLCLCNSLNKYLQRA